MDNATINEQFVKLNAGWEILSAQLEGTRDAVVKVAGVLQAIDAPIYAAAFNDSALMEASILQSHRIERQLAMMLQALVAMRRAMARHEAIRAGVVHG